MKHLKKEIINDIVYNFYEGGNLNAILNHNKNGQDGIMYIFIEDWDTYEQKLKRVSKNIPKSV